MNILDEETALSILFSNTKRKKRQVDLIALAQNCSFLLNMYGSREALAKKIGLSQEMIREIMLPLKLPQEIQELIRNRKIDSIDKVKQISALKGPSKQMAAAKEFVNTQTKDARDIKRLIESRELSAKRAREIISKAKPKDLHVFFIDFNEEQYRAILTQAKIRRTEPAELVKEIISDWLKRESTNLKKERE